MLLKGVNDTDADARRVVKLLANLNAKVNLIALNPGPGIPFETPAPERVASFQTIVRRSLRLLRPQAARAGRLCRLRPVEAHGTGGTTVMTHPIVRTLAIAAMLVNVSAQPRKPEFEVASVKPGPPGIERTSMNGGPLPAGPFNLSGNDPGRITWTNVGLPRMIQVAYDFPVDGISGPDWFNTEHYDIVATIPMGTSVADFRLMVQNLLADRFKLTLHRATKEVSGYALEIGKNGLKIKPASAAPNESRTENKSDESGRSSPLMMVDQSGFPAPRPGNPYFLKGDGFQAAISVRGVYRATALNEPMPAIAEFLGRFAGAPAEDGTGLSGKYDLHLEFTPNLPVAAGDAPVPAAADPGPGLFDAVQAQLGLKLTPKKVPVETLVIDRAEKVPTVN